MFRFLITCRRRQRFVGTPRNIYRHVVMSDFDQVAATLPRVSAGSSGHVHAHVCVLVLSLGDE